MNLTTRHAPCPQQFELHFITTKRRATTAVSVLIMGLLLGAASGLCHAQTTTLVSRNSAGQIADGAGLPTTGLPAVSADGWFVAFVSLIPDYVTGDTNGFGDVFLRNGHTNTTTRISVSTAGVQGDNISGLDPDSFNGSMGVSLDGRYVSFPSGATTLVAGDTNGITDIFVRDTVASTTSRVSLSSAGVQANGRCVHCAISPSADGRYVVFDSDATNLLVAADTNGHRDIFLRDRLNNTTERVSVSTTGVEADQDCVEPSVSADGRYVVFTSGATTLVPGGNPGRSIFLRDRTLGQTFLIGVSRDSAAGGGGSNPESAAVSNDGRYVAFASNSPALIGGIPPSFRRSFVKDRQTGTTTEVSVSNAGVPANGDSDNGTSISPDGRFVGFMSRADNLTAEGNPCRRWQAYVRDRTLNTTRLASVNAAGQPGDLDSGDHCYVSANGSVAVFDSNASNLVAGDANSRGDVFVHDFAAPATTLASVSSSGAQGTPAVGLASALLAMTPDARHVVLISNSGNLAGCIEANNTVQIYARDLDTGLTEFISITAWGGADEASSDAGVISDNGRFVAFTSESSQIINNDSNNARDIFLRDRLTQTTTRVSVATSGAEHNGVGFTDGPSISGDGRYVAFHSDASNLAGVPDANGSEDVFVRDTIASTTTLISRRPNGLPGNDSSYGADISGDGSKVAFISDVSDLVAGDTNGHKDVFVAARAGGFPVRVSLTSTGGQADLDSFNPSISGDGRSVAFVSTALNMVPGDTNNVSDIFVRDTVANTTTRVSVDSAGAQANGASFGFPVISRDGHWVVFCSDASNLVAGDNNNATDTFVHNLVTHTTVRVSVGAAGQQGLYDGGTGYKSQAISADGRYAGFSSFAPNLVAGDTNSVSDAFLRDTAFTCPADFNGDGTLDPDDLADYIAAFFFQPPASGSDFNGDGVTDPDDLADYIAAFFAGCG